QKPAGRAGDGQLSERSIGRIARPALARTDRRWSTHDQGRIAPVPRPRRAPLAKVDAIAAHFDEEQDERAVRERGEHGVAYRAASRDARHDPSGEIALAAPGTAARHLGVVIEE